MPKTSSKAMLYIGLSICAASWGFVPGQSVGGLFDGIEIPIRMSCKAGGAPPSGCTCTGDCQLGPVAWACVGGVINLPIFGPRCTCSC